MKYLIFFIYVSFVTELSGQIYSTVDGQIHFVSSAPLEIIEATSNQLQGVLDIENKTFAFKVYIKSFDGFNNPLQQVHFYENYMEVSHYPLATFKGKILESIILGVKKYRAKGFLSIHGKSIEQIINVELEVKENTIKFNSEINVLLEDYDIDLPRIVYQKIAEIINVNVQGELKRRE